MQKPEPEIALAVIVLMVLTLTNAYFYLENVRRQQTINQLHQLPTQIAVFYEKNIKRIGESYIDFYHDFKTWMQLNGYVNEYEAWNLYVAYLTEKWK